jgi:hypothetical protein
MPPDQPPPRDEGAKAVEIATDRVAKDYDRALDHSQHLSQRAATLVGFGGVTLALTANVCPKDGEILPPPPDGTLA